MDIVFTYTLQPGGYIILADGQPYVDQPFNPGLPFIKGQGQPFATEADALANCLANYPEATDANAPPVEPEATPAA